MYFHDVVRVGGLVVRDGKRHVFECRRCGKLSPGSRKDCPVPPGGKRHDHKGPNPPSGGVVEV